MTNSRAKGKAGELEFARLCRANGYEVRRTAQYCGKTGDAADCVGLPRIHIEVKRVEHLNIDDAIKEEIGWSMTESIERAFKVLEAKKGEQKDGH